MSPSAYTPHLLPLCGDAPTGLAAGVWEIRTKALLEEEMARTEAGRQTNTS